MQVRVWPPQPKSIELLADLCRACLALRMFTKLSTTEFATEGAHPFRGAILTCLDELISILEQVPKHEAGVRLHGVTALQPLLACNGPIGAIAAQVLGPSTRPVRAVLFNKSAETNWSLGWHQDRTICVKEKREAPGYGPWTLKSGLTHVAPPLELLTRMVTLRAHLDDVPATNAPLLIAPGSHKYGRISVDQVEDIVSRCGKTSCLAKAGDVWLYATPILHASEAASVPASRRVLQVDFAAEELPFGLEWLGV
jgi:hypothetical protein